MDLLHRVPLLQFLTRETQRFLKRLFTHWLFFFSRLLRPPHSLHLVWLRVVTALLFFSLVSEQTQPASRILLLRRPKRPSAQTPCVARSRHRLPLLCPFSAAARGARAKPIAVPLSEGNRAAAIAPIPAAVAIATPSTAQLFRCRAFHRQTGELRGTSPRVSASNVRAPRHTRPRLTNPAGPHEFRRLSDEFGR